MTLISFDIDGTMVFGSPPGCITTEMVREVKARGFIVGSASDRPISNQVQLWKEHQIDVDFVSLKHRLNEVKEKFAADRHIHVGDTEMDRYFATQAGFDFYFVNELPEELETWLQ